MPKEFKAEQVINGTFGEMWLDGEYMAQVISLKAEVTQKKNSDHNGAASPGRAENDRTGTKRGSQVSQDQQHPHEKDERVFQAGEDDDLYDRVKY